MKGGDFCVFALFCAKRRSPIFKVPVTFELKRIQSITLFHTIALPERITRESFWIAEHSRERDEK